MPVYIIDENLPSTVPLWNKEEFINVLAISNNFSDGDIWDYAIANNLVIITKDVDFYNRYMTSLFSPKIIWFRTGNIKKKEFYQFIEQIWVQIEEMLCSYSFIIITDKKIEAL